MAIDIQSVEDAIAALEAVGNAIGIGVPVTAVGDVLDVAIKLVQVLQYNQVAAAAQIAAADITADAVENKKFGPK